MKKDVGFSEDIKFFKRFLKEHGIYSKYKRYIRDRKTFNGFQKAHTRGWTFEGAVKEIGDIRLMITRLIAWSNTKEGFTFWENLHKKLRQEYKYQHLEDYDFEDDED
jgi:hypothetical protein